MDAATIRQAARDVADQAGVVRGIHRGLLRSADPVWQSLAADRFRERLHAESAALLRSAVLLDDAAAAWHGHAAAVEAGPGLGWWP